MSHTLIPVILAGGKGERFWPLSRKNRPKQFLSLDGTGGSLLQTTADRLVHLAGGWDKLWVCSSRQLGNSVQAQLPELPMENLLGEPEGRDTAPAVTWTALEIAKRYGEEVVMGFFPADHWIGDRRGFAKTIQAAVELAQQQEAIVTLGVKPAYPATGYGYIEQGAAQGSYLDLPVYQVKRFTEKPDLATAERFIAQGNFSWNSGIFIFRAAVVLKELAIHAPEILKPLQTQGAAAYGTVPKISIDYALMEKTQLAYVLPADFGWDDLGDWNAMARLLQGDQPNLELGNHVSLDTQGAIVYAQDPEEVIVTIGLEDMVIVRDRHATLIVKKDRTQDIKKVLELLKNNPKYQHLL